MERIPGACDRHCPGVFTPKNWGGGGLKPSLLRHAKMASATVCPHSMPRVIDWLCSAALPLEMAEREAARFASKSLF